MKPLDVLSVLLAVFTTVGLAEPAAQVMSQRMEMKASFHGMKQAAGVFAEQKYPSMGPTTCRNGKAGMYSCKNMDVRGSLSHGDMKSTTREGNDIWGWTSPDGREFAIVGQTDGTAFVEVLGDGRLKYRGRLPTQTTNNIWRDVKVIGSHAYIVAESPMHGMQVFDLTKLLALGDGKKQQPSKTFNTKSDLTALFRGIGSAHNVIANPETNTIFLSGGGDKAACANLNGGLMMIDVKDPSKPKLQGCAGAGNYVHDARCVVYRGPDTRFHGREICLTFNIISFDVYDVTDRQRPVILSTNYYDGDGSGKGAYAHQGWEIDDSFRYMLMDDERDEEVRDKKGLEARTTTYIWDLASLTHPVLTGSYKAPLEAIDHNLYVRDGRAYMANYASGLRVVDVSRLPQDPKGRNMRELAYFDCWPADDDDPEVAFYGAWSSYVWLRSGIVLLNCIEAGLFALKLTV